MTPTNQRRRPGCYLILAAIILLLFWLGPKGWRIARAAQSLQAGQTEAETLLAGGLTNLNPDAVESLVMGIRQDVVTLRDETAVFMPLMPHLAWLPKIGPTLAAAPQLMIMADAGTETAVYALRGFKPFLSVLNSKPPSIELIPSALQAINTAKPELATMNSSLRRIVSARNDMDNLDELPWRIHTLIEQFDEWLPLAQDGLLIAPYLPKIMGHDAPRNYLILAQNSDELRPTGGFISGVGLITVANGRIADLIFQDSYLVDNWKTKPYNFPPQPLNDHMLLELFLFRDANFWPDFPTSAEKAMELYSYGLDVPLPDGVIAIDQQFLEALVKAIGDINMSDSELVINENNISETLQAAWAIQEGQEINDWALSRKAFMGIFAAAIKEKIESDIASVDMAALAKNMSLAIKAKNLQIYLRDPEEAAILHELHWDGRLPSNPPHDFLLTVDTNMGYNKVNAIITRNLTYQIQIQNDGSTQAELTINYQHTGENINKPCNHGPLAYNTETVTSYQNLVNDCYWNYLRIYVPPGSQLLESSRQSIPSKSLMSSHDWKSSTQTINDLSGLTTFANFMMVQRGQNLNNQIVYQLPKNIIQSDNGQKQYRLALYKQAGTQPQPAAITIILPPQAILGEVVPTPTTIESNRLYFEFDLEKDTIVIVNYR